MAGNGVVIVLHKHVILWATVYQTLTIVTKHNNSFADALYVVGLLGINCDPTKRLVCNGR